MTNYQWHSGNVYKTGDAILNFLHGFGLNFTMIPDSITLTKASSLLWKQFCPLYFLCPLLSYYYSRLLTAWRELKILLKWTWTIWFGENWYKQLWVPTLKSHQAVKKGIASLVTVRHTFFNLQKTRIFSGSKRRFISAHGFYHL